MFLNPHSQLSWRPARNILLGVILFAGPYCTELVLESDMPLLYYALNMFAFARRNERLTYLGVYRTEESAARYEDQFLMLRSMVFHYY